ncbi:hypothetical protein JCM8547_008306 [Rhodosporidiobolus lusitaniae]
MATASPYPAPLASRSASTSDPVRASDASAQVSTLLKEVREGLELLLSRGGIDVRASRQQDIQQKVGACAACRESKVKCSQGMPSCSRCLASGVECRYVQHARRGRKRDITPNTLLIESILRTAERAYEAATGEEVEAKPLNVLRGFSPAQPLPPLSAPAPSTSSLPRASTSALPAVSEEEVGASEEEEAEALVESGEDLQDIVANPLALLAHVARGPAHRCETTEHESGPPSFPSAADAVTDAQQFFSSGLYAIRLDAAPELDIVNLGIVTLEQFASIRDFYFKHLYPSTLLFNPNLQTVELLRNTSPFLTSCLAFIVAGFLPQLSHLTAALQQHTFYLSDRIFSQGFRSLEIVQAYLLLAEWAPAASNWNSDKNWSFLGQAMRQVGECRFDKMSNQNILFRYASAATLPERALEIFIADRKRTCTVLCCSEIAASIATGRFEAISAINFFGGISNDFPDNPALSAFAGLHRIYAKALMLVAGLREELASKVDAGEVRQSFIASWEEELSAWWKKWPAPDARTQITALHTKTILLSLSLQLPGPAAPVLARCRSTALRTVRVVAQQADASLAYGPSALVTAIAYAATMLLRMESAKSASAASSDFDTIRPLCDAAAAALEAMAGRRPTIRTFAGLHAVRLRKLLDDFTEQRARRLAGFSQTLPSSAAPNPPQPASFSSPSDSTPAFSAEDVSLLALLAPYNSLLAEPSQQPTFSWLNSSFPSEPDDLFPSTSNNMAWPDSLWPSEL